MPARPAKPTPSFYPDTSTLSYAAASLRPNPSAGDVAIAAALREVSARANLCLSYTHVMELTRGGSEHGLPEVDFLDALETVWLVSYDRAEQRELRSLLRGAVLGVAPKPALPSAPSFLSQFEDLPVGAAVDYLRYPNLRAVVADAAKDRAHRGRLEAMAAAGRTFAERLFEDRQRALKDGVSAREFEVRLDEKFIENVRTKAIEAHHELTRQVRRDPNQIAPPPLELLPALLPALADLPLLLPTHFVINRAIRGAGEVAARKDSTSSSYFARRDGDLFDLGHLVGAAYCEGFCCDKRTAEQLGDARAAVGLPPAIVFNGDRELLAKQIRDSVR